jgi:hypothetical protein
MTSIWYPAARLTERAPYLPPLTAQVYAEGAAIALQQPAEAVEFPGGRVALQTLPPEPYAQLARATRVADVRQVLGALERLARGHNPDADGRRLPRGLGEILDPNGGPQTHRTDPSWGLFWENSTGWKRDLNVPHGQHYTFIDHQALIPWFERHFTVPPELIANTIGTVDPARILRTLNTYVPAFFDQHLRGRPGTWQDSPRHPDVRFIA